MTAHKHAALMLQYAQDAAETDTPWERWECKGLYLDWAAFTERHPTWVESCEYRRKPDPAKLKTLTYECWETEDGFLCWYAKDSAPFRCVNWNRVPGEDKTVEVIV